MKSLVISLAILGLVAAPLAGCIGGGQPSGLDETGGDGLGEVVTPEFALEGLILDREEVGVGDTVTVTTTVVNIGTEAGTAVVVPLWNGVQVAGTQEIDMLVGKRKELTFEFVAEEAGDHTIGLQVAGSDPVMTLVRVLAPAVELTEWRFENPYCEAYLDLNLTATNVGGALAEGYTVDAYSFNDEGRLMGHTNWTLEAVAAGESVFLEDSIFAPHECGTDDTYHLLFTVSVGGVEEWRLKTDPFRPVTTG